MMMTPPPLPLLPRLRAAETKLCQCSEEIVQKLSTITALQNQRAVLLAHFRQLRQCNQGLSIRNQVRVGVALLQGVFILMDGSLISLLVSYDNGLSLPLSRSHPAPFASC
jgi:hypothetical protein